MTTLHKVFQLNYLHGILLNPVAARASTKNSRRRKTNYIRKSKFKFGLIWLLGGILGGVLISNSLFMHLNSDKKPKPVPSAKLASNIQPRQQIEKPQPTFDFYTILSKPNDLRSVHTQSTAAAAAAETPAPLSPTQSAAPSQQYIVQAGAFKNHADADALRAELTLEGFDAQVEPARVNGNSIWYRVIIGPFAAEQKAIKTQQLLKQATNSNALVLKRDEQLLQ